jgi:hypothetical protein
MMSLEGTRVPTTISSHSGSPQAKGEATTTDSKRRTRRVTMTIRKVVRLGHPALRVVASECTSAELQPSEIQRVIDDMIDTMRDYEGVGIAANQVGVPSRIFVMEVWSNNP